MVADNESGRGKEGMVEPVHVFDVSHFMSFRERRGGEGEGRGEERRGGEGEEEKHVNFSGGGQKLASQETSDYLYGS